jgi:hypothetical protein
MSFRKRRAFARSSSTSRAGPAIAPVSMLTCGSPRRTAIRRRGATPLRRLLRTLVSS